MSYTHLNSFDRGRIQALWEAGKSMSEIATLLNRHRSTISREIRRHRVKDRYEAHRAQARYAQRRKECRPNRRLGFRPLWDYTVKKLSSCWSPEQISRRLRLVFPHHPRMRISHEALYQALYTDERLSPFIRYLRQARPKRRKRGQSKSGRSLIPNRVPISQRPPDVAQRTHFEDWEADLVLGKNQEGAILSLVGRKSRLLLARVVRSKQSEEVIQAAIAALEDLPAGWARSVTFDNGTEFYHHQRLSHELGIATYFADPYAAYQRGTNENTNGLLRQYLPKTTSFKNLSQQQLDDIVDEINNRPRKTHGYLTPYEVFHTFRKTKPVALDS
jgi:transposase, IS30 family